MRHGNATLGELQNRAAGPTTELHDAGGRRVHAELRQGLRARLREVHMEALAHDRRVEVEAEGVAQLPVALVRRGAVHHRPLGLDVAEARMLVEVAPKAVPAVPRRAGAAGGEVGAAHDPGVHLPDRRGGEVVVEGMRGEAVEHVDVRRAVLPDVAEHVVDADRGAEVVDGARRGPMREVDVAGGVVAPRRSMCRVLKIGRHRVAQAQVLVLHRQPDRLPRLLREVLAEGGRLVMAHLGGPIPWHGNFVGQRPQEIAIVRSPPKSRSGGLHVRDPVPALLGPIILLRIAAGLDEVEELPIAHKELGGGECGHLTVRLPAELVIPAVGRRALPGPAEPRGSRGDRDEPIRRRALRDQGLRVAMEPALVTQRERRHGLHDAQVGLTVDDARGLKMNPLVLDAHHDHPPEGVLLHGPLHGPRLDQAIHELPDLVAEVEDLLQKFGGPLLVLPGLRAAGPDVGVRVEIVPTHLVHSDRHLHLEHRVDALRDVLTKV
mmetsp:Transcript_24167/g.69534  ORF Transcript_24167/g.69534 Transcript_24167/m.69534 type:complete len:492 (+) Transcript_24167:1591-3066(+)